MPCDFSVIIPTFRRPGPLREAIQSALAQQGVEVEVLVIDDSPEGSGRAVVEALADARVQYRLRDVPSGGNPSAVRNEGWPLATGRFLHFLDDDDRVLPTVYLSVAAAFDARPDRGVVFGRIQPFGDDHAVLEREQLLFATAARRARLFQRFRSPLMLVANQLFSSPTVLVNSACFIRREGPMVVGGYDEGQRIMEDVDFWLHSIRRLGFTFLDQVVVEYRTGAPSIMHDAHRTHLSVSQAYAGMYDKYAARYGQAELLALKLIAKTTLRWV